MKSDCSMKNSARSWKEGEAEVVLGVMGKLNYLGMYKTIGVRAGRYLTGGFLLSLQTTVVEDDVEVMADEEYESQAEGQADEEANVNKTLVSAESKPKEEEEGLVGISVEMDHVVCSIIYSPILVCFLARNLWPAFLCALLSD